MHFIKRKNGIAVRFYIEENGIKVQKYLYEKGWKKEDAESACVAYRNKVNIGMYQNEKITVSEFFEKWFEDYALKNVNERTAVRYAEFIRIHICPNIGNIQIAKIRPSTVQKLYSDKINEGLSPATVLQMHRILNNAMRHAVQWEYITNNPISSCKPPRQIKKELIIPSDKELSLILSEVANSTLWYVLYVAFTTGMREGEICALQLDDVDYQNERYIITQGYVLSLSEGTYVLKNTKTHRSSRPISWISGTKEILANYIEIRNQWKMSYKFKESGHFFVWEDGRPIRPDYCSKTFRKIIKKLNLDNSIHFHSLRHYHASWLLRQGIHPKIVAERLGHANINITLNTYTHLIPDMQKDVISKLKIDL